MTPRTESFYRHAGEIAQDLDTAVIATLEAAPPMCSRDEASELETFASAEELAPLTRVLRTGLKSIHVAGISGDVGRDAVVLSLARTLAETGRRILVIDADVDGPPLAEAGRRGLSDVIDGISPLAPAIVPSPGYEGMMAFLPIGNRRSALETPGAVEPLVRILEEARPSYDVTLVSAPCLDRRGKVHPAATACEGVLLVLSPTVISRDRIRRNFLQLWGVEAPIRGLISLGVPDVMAEVLSDREKSASSASAASIASGEKDTTSPERGTNGEPESHEGAANGVPVSDPADAPRAESPPADAVEDEDGSPAGAGIEEAPPEEDLEGAIESVPEDPSLAYEDVVTEDTPGLDQAEPPVIEIDGAAPETEPVFSSNDDAESGTEMEPGPSTQAPDDRDAEADRDRSMEPVAGAPREEPAAVSDGEPDERQREEASVLELDAERQLSFDVPAFDRPMFSTDPEPDHAPDAEPATTQPSYARAAAGWTPGDDRPDPSPAGSSAREAPPEQLKRVEREAKEASMARTDAAGDSVSESGRDRKLALIGLGVVALAVLIWNWPFGGKGGDGSADHASFVVSGSGETQVPEELPEEAVLTEESMTEGGGPNAGAADEAAAGETGSTTTPATTPGSNPPLPASARGSRDLARAPSTSTPSTSAAPSRESKPGSSTTTRQATTPTSTPPAKASPAPASPSIPTMSSPRFSGVAPFYAVHLTSFRSKEGAASDAERLARVTGFAADYIECVITGEGKNKGKWYRVIIGRFDDPARAESAARSFREKGITDYARVYRITGS